MDEIDEINIMDEFNSTNDSTNNDSINDSTNDS